MARGSNSNNSNKIYLSIWGGKIVEKLKDGDPNGKTFVNPKDNTKSTFGIIDDYVIGIIANIYIEQNDYNGQRWSTWNVEMYDKDELEVLVLRMPFRSSYAEQFLRRVESIDFTKPVKLAPDFFEGEKDDKWISVLHVMQGGEGDHGWQKIESNYTREAPNGLPELEPKEVNGETVWDSGKRIKYWMEMVAGKILPKLPGGALGQKVKLDVDDRPVRIDYVELMGSKPQKQERVADSIEANESVQESMDAQNVSSAAAEVSDKEEPIWKPSDQEDDDLPF